MILGPVSNDPVRLSWLFRSDLRKGAPVSPETPSWFRLWWAIDGLREYPVWTDRFQRENLQLLAPFPDSPSHERFGMTPLLRHLLDRRDDLQKAFDVSTEQGLWHAIAWLYTHGLNEHALMDLVDAETLAALDKTPPFLRLPGFPEDDHSGLNWLMFFVWRCAGDLQEAFDLRNAQGQADYLQWFLLEGVPKYHLAPLVSQRWRDWLLCPLDIEGQSDTTVYRGAFLMWRRRQDLQQAIDLRSPDAWSALTRWTREAQRIEPGLWWLEESEPTAPPSGDSKNAELPFGVNLIGFAFGELGIGEDVRMAALACESAGIPFKVVNIHPGENLRQADRAVENHIADRTKGENEAPYAINVFCLTGFDTARVYLERGVSFFEGRYNIGWWPWELPVWPQDWDLAFNLVDEIWAATEFTREMYRLSQQRTVSASAKPVTLMPLPASISRAIEIKREKLGLPADRFLFLYVFDFNSYLARKNPFAAVKAFREAFPASDRSVGLVLKTMNSNPENPVWMSFLAECTKDPRITLIDTTLDRGEILGLIDACDAYVSLHRSEGFGRTLAEAMLFGKPVVGTDFSGNVDFLTPETGFPVKWQRREVAPGEYPFVTDSDAAWWADPDIAHAALQLRAARNATADKACYERVKRFAEEQFSPERIGIRIKQRLDALAKEQAGQAAS